MKNFKSLLALTIFILIYAASTSTKNYYQVYETKSENSKLDNNLLSFEDENCEISYNLWGEEGGNAGFSIFNKTNQLITLNKDKCFFILNGISYDYYLNRITSATIDYSSSNINSTYYTYRKATQSISNSTSYKENEKLIIPPNSMKFINEYRINKTAFRNCNLLRFPKKSENPKIDFDKGNSPFVFKNYITYSLNEKEYVIENNFYVSSIYNLPEDKVVEVVYIENCGVKTDKTEEIFINEKPNLFYIRYSKGSLDQKY